MFSWGFPAFYRCIHVRNGYVGLSLHSYMVVYPLLFDLTPFLPVRLALLDRLCYHDSIGLAGK